MAPTTTRSLRSIRTKRGVVFCTLLLTNLLSVHAQTPQVNHSAQATAVRLTPSEAIAAITIHPRRIAAGKRLELAPFEVATAAGLEYVGIDPLKIERFDLLVGSPGGLEGPQGGAIVQLTEAFDINNLNPQMLDGNGLQRDGDFEYLAAPPSPPPTDELIYHQLTPQTIVVGTKMFVKLMVADKKQPGKVASLLQQVETEQDLLAIVSVESLRPLILGAIAQPLSELPPQLAQDSQAIIEATDYIAIAANISDEERLQIVLTAATAADADKLDAAFERSSNFSRQNFVAEFKNQFSDASPTSTAARSYIDRLDAALAGMMAPVRNDRSLVIDFADFQSMAVIGTLSGMILPAVQIQRQAAQQFQGSNNLKQIGLAFHNFESAYRSLPAASGLDDDGKPMLSWRVALLPYMEELELYNEFHLDEPWDSDHNIQLLERIPDVYRHPTCATEPGYTVYQLSLSDKSLMRKTEPTQFREITDGMSNTILAVETNAEAAVPWTAPQDYEIDEDDPGANLFTDGMTQILISDGSVHTIADTIAAEVLNALYTRAGGEVVELP